MRKVLQKMSLLAMLLMLCIGAKAADVTATWDFANNCASLPAKSDGGAYTGTTMASDCAGIESAGSADRVMDGRRPPGTVLPTHERR